MLLPLVAAAGIVLLALAAFPQVHGPRWHPGWLGLACIAAVAVAPVLATITH